MTREVPLEEARDAVRQAIDSWSWLSSGPRQYMVPAAGGRFLVICLNRARSRGEGKDRDGDPVRRAVVKPEVPTLSNKSSIHIVPVDRHGRINPKSVRQAVVEVLEAIVEDEARRKALPKDKRRAAALRRLEILFPGAEHGRVETSVGPVLVTVVKGGKVELSFPDRLGISAAVRAMEALRR